MRLRINIKFLLCLLICISSGLIYSQSILPGQIINNDGTFNSPAQTFNAAKQSSTVINAAVSPNCYTSFYSQVSSIYESGLSIPNTSTLVALPPSANGFAIGPAFGFPAPNPTFWTILGSNYAYYDGTNFINTGHSTTNAAAVNIGGSKNFIYNLVGGTGQVYKYNGTGAATLVATIPALAGGGPYDITGDDQDNFYYLRAQTPQSLNVYDPNGILTCSYSVTGLLPASAGGGFAIVGNTVTAHTGAGYYVGVIAGTVVNFTSTPSSFGSPFDFANCYILNTFSTTLAASPSSSLTCTNPSITLSASSTLSPVSYTWSGPGVVSPINSQTVLVNAAGVYTCSLTATSGCPVKTSVSTFTVYGGTSLLTPTISSSGSLTCTNPTAQLSVAPNSVTNTILWTGPGIVGANNTPTIIVSAAGIYSVTLTNTLCSGTSTFNVSSGIAPLTLTASASATQICTPVTPVTLSVTGATTYTWAAITVPITGSVVLANPSTTTSYTVSGTTGVCSGNAIITVSVNPTPTIIVTSGSPTICAGTSAVISATGASSYTWNPGNLVGSSATVSPGITTIYTVTGSNGSCSATATETVYVIPGPTLTANASPTAICQNNSSTLTATGAISYTWQPGSLNGSIVSVTPPTTSIYTVSGSNILGCTSSATLQLIVIPNPTITISPSSPTICAGSGVTLTASGASGYTWSPGGTNGASIAITPSASSAYTVTGANGSCQNTATIFITVNPSPTVSASSSNSIICAGSSATLSAAGANTYTWNPGNITGATITVSPGSSTVYTVTGTAAGCTDTETVSVLVNNGPTVSVVSSPTTVCSASGASATLTASGAVSYIWNPGGTVSSSIVITPTITSSYSIIASDATGCISTTTLSYFVTQTPTINLSPTFTNICIGKTLTLTASGATSYTWNPGSLNGSTISVTPLSNTTYTVTGANGNCTSTGTVSVIVNANPTITAASSASLICSGNSSTLSSGGASSYTWNPGALTGQTVNVSPVVNTNYTVIGSSAAGCTSSAVTSVSVNPTPTLVPVATPTAICSGGSSTLSVSGATSYTWNPSGATSSSLLVTPTVTTTYTVSGLTNNCLSTKTVTVKVNSIPVITAVANPTAICFGNSSTLTAAGASTYTWNPGNLAGASVPVSPAANTIYTVAGTSSLGCTNSGTVSITVNANPTITATSNPTVLCSGSGATATLTGTGASQYTWNPGNLSGSTVTVSPNATTVYTVAGSNASGCTKTQTVSITISPTPTLTVTGTPTAICRGSSATLSAIGAANYTWMPGGSTNTTIVVSPTVTTVYTVTGNSGVCSAAKTFTLIVLPRPNVNITAIPPVICKGGFSLLLATGAASYTWSPGAATGNTLVVSPLVTTSYSVTGINFAGCTNTAVTTVTVNPTPTIATVPSATQVCSGTTVSLSSSGALTYIVAPGAQTGSVVLISPTVTTNYTVTGINIFGCTDTKTLIINVLPNPTITASSSGTLLCDGGTFSLTASGATSYTWMPLSLSGNSIVTTATNSISSYTVTGENAGCTSIAVLTVQVLNCNNTIFGITKAAGTPTLVYNEFYNVSFTVTAVNASSLNLTNIILNENLLTAFPAPSTFSIISAPVITSQNSSLSINPLFDGVSQISLTSPSSSTLLANKRDTICFTIRIDPKQFYGPFKNSVIGFADFLNAFTVADSSNDGFAWDPDQDGNPTNNDIPTIINLPYSELFIPSGFSPDDDGKNDLFVIKGLNGRKIKLTIFNRWGNKVYEKQEYDNTWNAVANGGGIMLGNNKVPPSTYYYIIEFMDGDKETRTGFLVVQY
ncbi:MAG: gliding motility-associated C-terminal domain-containing protein [Bacteroidetes bacterium]|nr:gliding motility-associated C-terminal domain-containing protein [Bacteroidota bacterium]